jgi:hypothetical protein
MAPNGVSHPEEIAHNALLNPGDIEEFVHPSFTLRVEESSKNLFWSDAVEMKAGASVWPLRNI